MQQPVVRLSATILFKKRQADSIVSGDILNIFEIPAILALYTPKF
jgi:hypothetical protein